MVMRVTSRCHNLEDRYKTLSALQPQHINPELLILKGLSNCGRPYESEIITVFLVVNFSSDFTR